MNKAVESTESANTIKLRKHTKIGELDAENDQTFLKDCFINIHEFQAAMDCSQPGSIILGRVGSGKSALLLKIAESCEHPIRLDPQALAFKYLENSTMLRFVEGLGVNLNTFYKLLWRHVLVVELLRARFSITDSRIQANFFESLSSKLGINEKRRKGLDYVKEWGDKFWEETETRVKEVTQKFENEIGASLGASFGADFSIDGKASLSTEQKQEFITRATKVVNGVQIKRLGEVLELLGHEDLLGDAQRQFHVLIDDLDANWATTDTRCRLIRALIEEIRSFRPLKSVKIVCALRRDLLRLVYTKTRDSGFQEEKYESQILELRWSDIDLRRLVDSRVSVLFKYQYSQDDVTFDTLFPTPKGGGTTPFDYMLQRSLRRPRDLIQFVNESFKIAENKSRVSFTDIRKAETSYSEKRRNSLLEEWSEIYPSLLITLEILRQVPSKTTPEFLLNERLALVVSQLLNGNPQDPCVSQALSLTDPKTSITERDVLDVILQCLYQIGVVGVKTDTNDTLSWSSKDQEVMSQGEISRCVRLAVHKMVWQTFNTPQEGEESPND